MIDYESLTRKFYCRLKSLLLHPDKNPHAEARVAFDELQRALKEIEDKDKFRTVLRYIKDARDSIFFHQGIKVPKEGEDIPVETCEDLIRKHPKLGRLIQLEFVRMVKELAFRDQVFRVYWNLLHCPKISSRFLLD